MQTLGRVDDAMNQFINGRPADAGNLFIHKAVFTAFISRPGEPRPLKRNGAAVAAGGQKVRRDGFKATCIKAASGGYGGGVGGLRRKCDKDGDTKARETLSSSPCDDRTGETEEYR